MDVIDEILAHAERKKLSQSELEVRARLGKARISKWKKGIGSPSFDQVVRMATVVGASLDELAGWSAPSDLSKAEAMVWRLVKMMGVSEAFGVLLSALPDPRARVEVARASNADPKAIEGPR